MSGHLKTIEDENEANIEDLDDEEDDKFLTDLPKPQPVKFVGKLPPIVS